MGWWTLGECRYGSVDPREVRDGSGKRGGAGTGQRTLGEVWDGSGDP